MNPLRHFIGNQQKIKVGVVLGQSLGQIRFNVLKKNEEAGIINRFFSHFTWEYLLKQKVVVVQTPESKFKTNIA